MRIIVVGTGDLGFHVAKRFSEEHHDVVVVGRDDEALHWAQEVLDVSAVRGHGGSPSVLVEAGVRSADVMVAATSSDETNIVACLIAEAIAPSATRVARLHDPAYLGSSGIIDQSSLSIDYVISPEEEVAKAIDILAGVPGASDALEFAGGRVMAVGVKIDDDCPLIGTPVTELRRYDPSRLMVAGVYRGEQVQAPSADIRYTPGDTVFLVGGRDAMRRAMTRLGKSWVRTRSAVIAGGGWEGVAVARRLSAAGIHTKIIERDPAVCEAITHELEDTLVLLGDAHDQGLLVDEGVQRADLFVSQLSGARPTTSSSPSSPSASDAGGSSASSTRPDTRPSPPPSASTASSARLAPPSTRSSSCRGRGRWSPSARSARTSSRASSSSPARAPGS